MGNEINVSCPRVTQSTAGNHIVKRMPRWIRSSQILLKPQCFSFTAEEKSCWMNIFCPSTVRQYAASVCTVNFEVAFTVSSSSTFSHDAKNVVGWEPSNPSFSPTILKFSLLDLFSKLSTFSDSTRINFSISLTLFSIDVALSSMSETQRSASLIHFVLSLTCCEIASKALVNRQFFIQNFADALRNFACELKRVTTLTRAAILWIHVGRSAPQISLGFRAF